MLLSNSSGLKYILPGAFQTDMINPPGTGEKV